MTGATAVRRCGAVVATLVAVGLALVAGADQASAHAELVETEPSNGQRVPSPPTQVRLRFSESVDVALGVVRILGPDGKRVGVGAMKHPRADAATVTVPVRGRLRDGLYTVAWQVTSSDSHPVQGAFAFAVGNQVGAGSAAGSEVPADGPAPVTSRSSPLVGYLSGIARAVAFAGLALLVGATFFLVWCWPAGARQPGARRLLRLGWCALAGATGLGLLLYGPYVSGQPLGAMAKSSLLADTLNTRFGVALLLRLALLAVSAAGVWLLLRRPLPDSSRARFWRGTAVLAGACALATTWSIANHSAVGPQAPVAIVADVLHLVGMAVWLGGLVVVAAALLTVESADRVRVAVHRFSTVALACVVVLVVSGTYQAWRHIGSVAALTGTDYGGILLLKLVLVLVLVGLAFGARRWVRRHAEPGVCLPGAKARRRESVRSRAGQVVGLRRSVVAEAGVAVLVLVLTAVLVNTEPGRAVQARAEAGTGTSAADASPGSTPPATPDQLASLFGAGIASAGTSAVVTLPYDTGGPAGQGILHLVLAPAKVGVSTMHLAVVDRQGRPKDPAEIGVAARLAKPALGPIGLKVARSGPGHYLSLPAFPLPGQWKLDITIRTSEVDQVTVSTPVAID